VQRGSPLSSERISPEITRHTEYSNPMGKVVAAVSFLLVAAIVYFLFVYNAPPRAVASNRQLPTTYTGIVHDVPKAPAPPVAKKTEEPKPRPVLPTLIERPVRQPVVVTPQRKKEEEKPFVIYQAANGNAKAVETETPASSTDKIISYLKDREEAVVGGSSTASSAAAGSDRDSVEGRTASMSSGYERSRPYVEADLSTVVLAGHVVPAVLDFALDSSLPGELRAYTVDDVFSADGKRLLIPKSSLVTGRYRSALTTGDTRVFIVFNRIQMPGGQMMQIDSPAIDQIGRSGIEGDVDTRFWTRFGSSILLSIVSGVVEDVGSDTSSSITINSANSFEEQAAIALRNSINIPPVVRVPQGAEIRIFVNKDLDFSSLL